MEATPLAFCSVWLTIVLDFKVMIGPNIKLAKALVLIRQFDSIDTKLYDIKSMNAFILREVVC